MSTLLRLLGVMLVAPVHAMSGTSRRGYAYLLALVLLPLGAWGLQGVASLLGAVPPAEAWRVGAVAYVALFIALAVASARAARRATAGASRRMTRTQWAHFVILGVASFTVLGASVLSFFAAPIILQDAAAPGTSSMTVPRTQLDAKVVSGAPGSVTLRLVATKDGAPLPGARVELLFHGGWRSPMLPTDDRGEAYFRLPEGRWRIAAAQVNHMDPSRAVLRFAPPIPNRDLELDSMRGDVSFVQDVLIDIH
jgi:hypothetical protein